MKRRADGPPPMDGGWAPRGPPRGPPLMDGPPPPRGTPGPAGPTALPEDPIMLREVRMNKKLAGVVIGHNGTNVSRIRRESRCKLHVAQVVPGTDVQHVELTGTGRQIEHAERLIREVLKDFDPNYQIDVAESLRTTVEIFPEMVGSILGKGGQTIKTMREKTGAHMHVAEIRPGETMQYVEIAGTIQQIKAGYDWARTIIERFDPAKARVLAAAGAAGPRGGGGGPPPHMRGPGGPPHPMDDPYMDRPPPFDPYDRPPFDRPPFDRPPPFRDDPHDRYGPPGPHPDDGYGPPPPFRDRLGPMDGARGRPYSPGRGGPGGYRGGGGGGYAEDDYGYGGPAGSGPIRRFSPGPMHGGAPGGRGYSPGPGPTGPMARGGPGPGPGPGPDMMGPVGGQAGYGAGGGSYGQQGGVGQDRYGMQQFGGNGAARAIDPRMAQQPQQGGGGAMMQGGGGGGGMMGQQAQMYQTAQGAAGAGAGGPGGSGPVVLMLQSDGTYKPVQVQLMYNAQGGVEGQVTGPQGGITNLDPATLSSLGYGSQHQAGGQQQAQARGMVQQQGQQQGMGYGNNAGYPMQQAQGQSSNANLPSGYTMLGQGTSEQLQQILGQVQAQQQPVALQQQQQQQQQQYGYGQQQSSYGQGGQPPARGANRPPQQQYGQFR